MQAIDLPKYVGGYQLGGHTGLRVNFIKRPSWWHRFWMRICLGWTWIDTNV